MPGSGLSGSGAAVKLRSRHIATRGGRKLLGYACGYTFCDDKAFQARHIATRGGRKLYAISSECFKKVGVEFVGEAVGGCPHPGHRVSTVVRLKLRLEGTSNCFDDDLCPEADLAWDPVNGGWHGSISIGGHTTAARFECIGDGGSGSGSGTAYDYRVTLDDICRHPSVTFPVLLPVASDCGYPFRAGAQWAFEVPSGCCANFNAGTVVISVNVWGLQRPRYAGRFVATQNGLKVFAVGDCCPKGPCPEQAVACCGCEVSPWQWRFTVAGVVDRPDPAPECTTCPDFNGDWVVTRLGSDVCVWRADHAGICTPGPPWTLNCSPSQGEWSLTTSSFGGNQTTYTRSVADWDCLGPNVMTRTTEHGACEGFPATITVEPV